MNTYIESNLVFLGSPPNCRVYNSASVSLTTSTATPIAMDSERYKSTSTMHSTSSNNSRVVATVAGTYAITGYSSYAFNASGFRRTRLFHNNTTTISSVSVLANSVSSNATDLVVSADWNFLINEYVELVAFQSSGISLNISATPAISPELSMHWVSF